jgi:hypothetical protein
VFHSKQIDKTGKLVRSQFEKIESENSYSLMHIKYHQDNYFIQSGLERKLNHSPGSYFIRRIDLIRKRKRIRVSKDLISEFFVLGDFGQRRFK